ncbi:hypothetical protein DDO07_03760 [Vibrio cholerae]|uniref:Uncharacterized protein n=1 Tax=Vibrio cholerae TaxID=666 RepID=A0A5Q6PNA6_VIBCL|nr:hypothetical protein [Vibrio cholerae]EGR4048335.1 hypothetical protein [Vibrio cholerae]EGR4163568.1 hypothetical protein [Vibrio cholerae]EGR4171182.1 hypothetical protein [Vibrio cholerae]EGR4201781.1 hypothetical protein [Vibrio cholerae]
MALFPRLWFNFGLNIRTVNLKKTSPNNGAGFINKGKTRVSKAPLTSNLGTLLALHPFEHGRCNLG